MPRKDDTHVPMMEERMNAFVILMESPVKSVKLEDAEGVWMITLRWVWWWDYVRIVQNSAVWYWRCSNVCFCCHSVGCLALWPLCRISPSSKKLYWDPCTAFCRCSDMSGSWSFP